MSYKFKLIYKWHILADIFRKCNVFVFVFSTGLDAYGIKCIAFDENTR